MLVYPHAMLVYPHTMLVYPYTMLVHSYTILMYSHTILVYFHIALIVIIRMLIPTNPPSKGGNKIAANVLSLICKAIQSFRILPLSKGGQGGIKSHYTNAYPPA
jgi:hypothetical protein